MKQRISNDFKERLLKGEVTTNFDVNLYAVNSHFKDVYDTEDISIEQFRKKREFDIFSNNNYNKYNYAKNCFSACSFDYLTMPVTYSAYYNNDVADKPLFVNKDNWDTFEATYRDVEGDANMSRIREYIEPNGRDFENRGGGFYYVQEKSQMKWIANRVNNDYDFNNKLIIVLGDDLGGAGVTESGHDETEYYTELDFCICPLADRPFNGVFDLNGHTINMFNVICSDYSNGVIGYLGSNGLVCNGRIGKLVFENRKKISLKTIKTENTDIFVGGLVGTNYGTVQNIETFGRIEFRGFMPEVYLVQNKEEYHDNVDTIIEDSEENVFWPDRFCMNSPWNTIPYVGYFCEGTDSYFNSRTLEDQISEPNHQDRAYHEIKRVVHNFYDHKNHSLFKCGKKEIFYHDKYVKYCNMIRDCQIPIAQDLDDGSLYTEKLISQYRVNNSDFSEIGKNFMRSLLVSHAAECAFSPKNNGSELGNTFKNHDNWRLFFHKRMNKSGRNAYYCSPIVGTNFGTITNINAFANIVESQDTFVGFIGLVTGKHNKGVISNVAARLSVTENKNHSDTLRTYKNSQQFDGEGKNRAFGYHYHRDMNTNNKHTNAESYHIPLYSLCYLDANAGPSGPDWAATKTSGYNWFHQMGTKEYDYCNWYVREDERQGSAQVTNSGENWVALKNKNYVGNAFKRDDVVKNATENAMVLHLSHAGRTCDGPTSDEEKKTNSDFAISLSYTHNIKTPKKDLYTMDYTPHIRFYDTSRIETENLPDDGSSENRILTLNQTAEMTWDEIDNAFKNDDLGIPHMNFNSCKETSYWDNNTASAFDFDVVEFKLEYLSNNFCTKHHGSDSPLYIESTTPAYNTSAFEEMQINAEAEPQLYEKFKQWDGKYYSLNSAYKQSCSARALEINEQLMLQGIALGTQCAYHVAHEADSNFLNWGSSNTNADTRIYKVWGDPGNNGGHNVSYGFLGFNTNDNCKHDWYADNPTETYSNLPSIRSSMASIIVDNKTLPDAFIKKLLVEYEMANGKDQATAEEIVKTTKNKVQVERIYSPVWNTSPNKRRSSKIGNTDYYRNYIYFGYCNSVENGNKSVNIINYMNISMTYIHFNILVPEKVIDLTSGKEEYNYNSCRIIRGILELPTMCLDIPICITHVTAKSPAMEIPNVTYEEHENVFYNIKEYNEAIENETQLPEVVIKKIKIPKYSDGLEHPTWKTSCPAQKVDVFLEVAPYSMDEIASSENLEYHMPSIYNIGGIAGMWAPTFVGPDWSQSISEYGAGRHHYIKDCSIIVEPETKEFVERSICASIKGKAKTAVVIEDPGKTVEYAVKSRNDLYIANKFAGIAPIIELNAGDMGVFPGTFQTWTSFNGSENFTYNPHPDYMRALNRFANNIKNVQVFIKPYALKDAGKFITTSRINNQFFSNYFNWLNHSMAFDATIGGYQMTTANESHECAYIYGVTWDQPNPLAPILGRQYFVSPAQNLAISDTSDDTMPKIGNQYQLSFAEYAANGRYPNDYDDQQDDFGGTMTNGWETYVVNPTKLFGDWHTPGKRTSTRGKTWNNRTTRQSFARHYDIAGYLLNFQGLYAYEPIAIDGRGNVAWGKTTEIRDIYMNPMMNSCSDSTDLYQPMYSENSNFCNMKMARPIMCVLTRNMNADPTYTPLVQSFADFNGFGENLDMCSHFADKGEVKDRMFTYDYKFGESVHHDIEKPAIDANIHYAGHKFLFQQYEGTTAMPITRKGKYNDGSVLHLGLVPTASALPELIGNAANGVYEGSIAVSGNGLAGFLITDKTDDENVIGFLDFERDVNLNSGAFVYQFRKTNTDNDKPYGIFVEVN